jgi:hypothetical protein
MVNSETDWVQWGVETALGVFAVAYGFVLNYFAGELSKVKEKQEHALGDAQEHAAKGDHDLWQALEEMRKRLDNVVSRGELDKLRLALEEDRKTFAEHRADIAGKMVTRHELDRQLDQQYNRLVATWGRRENGDD